MMGMNLFTKLLRYVAPNYVAKLEAAKLDEALKREQQQAAMDRLTAWPTVPKYHYILEYDIDDSTF